MGLVANDGARVDSSGDAHKTFAPTQHVIVALKGDVLVLVDALAGEYFTLNETGSRIWELASQGANVSTIAHGIAAEFGAESSQAEIDAADLLRRLVAAGLMKDTSPESASL